jgi:hypothetical protein
MSAANAAVTEDGRTGYVLTDSAVSMGIDDYVVHGHMSKCLTLPHARSVFGMSGHCAGLNWAAGHLGVFSEFEEIEGHATEMMAADFPRVQAAFRGHLLQFVLMGWSPNEGKIRLSHTRSDLGFKFERSTTGCFITPSLPGCDEAGRGARDLPDLLMRITQFQRDTPQPWNPRDPTKLAHVVGGKAVLTTVTRGSISQRIVHDWGDKIGERISA